MKFSPKNIKLKNGQNIILRSVTSEDSKNMLDHLKTTHKESYKNMNQSAAFWESMSISDEKNILTDFETSKSKFMLVAVSENRIVGGLGFVGYQAEFVKHSGQLGMSIQNAFSNVGLGTEMMKYTLELAKDFGFHRIDLSVRTYNINGIALYEKVGFKRIGLLKHAAFIDGQYVDEYSYQFVFNED